MDVNEFVMLALVRERLDEARAMAARNALVIQHVRPRPRLRLALGTAMIRLGRRIIGNARATRERSGRQGSWHRRFEAGGDQRAA